MEAGEGEEKEGGVCMGFEPQAWRQSLCRNCFQTWDEHLVEGQVPFEGLPPPQTPASPQEKDAPPKAGSGKAADAGKAGKAGGKGAPSEPPSAAPGKTGVKDSKTPAGKAATKDSSAKIEGKPAGKESGGVSSKTSKFGGQDSGGKASGKEEGGKSSSSSSSSSSAAASPSTSGPGGKTSPFGTVFAPKAAAKEDSSKLSASSAAKSPASPTGKVPSSPTGKSAPASVSKSTPSDSKKTPSGKQPGDAKKSDDSGKSSKAPDKKEASSASSSAGKKSGDSGVKNQTDDTKAAANGKKKAGTAAGAGGGGSSSSAGVERDKGEKPPPRIPGGPGKVGSLLNKFGSSSENGSGGGEAHEPAQPPPLPAGVAAPRSGGKARESSDVISGKGQQQAAGGRVSTPGEGGRREDSGPALGSGRTPAPHAAAAAAAASSSSERPTSSSSSYSSASSTTVVSSHPGSPAATTPGVGPTGATPPIPGASKTPTSPAAASSSPGAAKVGGRGSGAGVLTLAPVNVTSTSSVAAGSKTPASPGGAHVSTVGSSSALGGAGSGPNKAGPAGAGKVPPGCTPVAVIPVSPGGGGVGGGGGGSSAGTKSSAASSGQVKTALSLSAVGSPSSSSSSSLSSSAPSAGAGRGGVPISVGHGGASAPSQPSPSSNKGVLFTWTSGNKSGSSSSSSSSSTAATATSSSAQPSTPTPTATTSAFHRGGTPVPTAIFTRSKGADLSSLSDGKGGGVRVWTPLSPSVSGHGPSDSDSAPPLLTKQQEIDLLTTKVSDLELRCTQLEAENSKLRRSKELAVRSQEDARAMEELKRQLAASEARTLRLEQEYVTLEQKLAAQAAAPPPQTQEDAEAVRARLESAERQVRDLYEENAELQEEVAELREEIEETYDSFREHEHEEFRELQKELELTAKNCRILQFKLRKSERRNDQAEQEKMQYEERIRQLQAQGGRRIERGDGDGAEKGQFHSEDAREHIASLAEELAMAKEVSVRLHDELDCAEDRRAKLEEENRHLTDILEQADRKQFRLEMEIDRLRDQIAELKRQGLAKPAAEEPKECVEQTGSPTKDEDWSWRSQEKSPLGVVGRQGSGEPDQSQLMKDLYDSVERETDLKEQLKFMEEEARSMRRKLAELEEENESLNLQVKKMSKQRRQQQAQGGPGGVTGGVTGGLSGETRLSAEEGSDSDLSDVDSTLQLELLEQELAVARKKMAEGEAERERLEAKVKELTEVTEAQARELSMRPERAPSPVVPDQYWEEKLRQSQQECDDLRWRLIEKEREVERLSTQAQQHHLSRRGRLKKSKSLDSDNPQIWELRKHAESLTQEAQTLRDMLALEQAETARLTKANQKLEDTLAQKQQVPAIVADDAAVVNIELRDRVSSLEAERRALQERVRMLSDGLQTLSRRGGERARAEEGLAAAGISSSSSSPSRSTPSPSRSVTPSPPASPTHARHGKKSRDPSKRGAGEGGKSRDSSSSSSSSSARQVAVLVEENLDLRRRLAELESTVQTSRERGGSGGGSAQRASASVASAAAAAVGEPKEHEAGSTAARKTYSAEREGDGPKTGTTQEGEMADKGKNEGLATGESRMELMEKVMDLEDELSDLQVQMRHKEEQYTSLERDMESLRSDMETERQDYETQLTELRAEVDMLQEKNAVLSNLLDIVQERADEAEGELERFARENSASPSDRSASNVSALSDASVGSDEVFVGGLAADKGNAILKDWDSQMKKRVTSLERLLAEERQKVAMAEKKLALAAPHDVTSAISDDVKLHLREKEILQEEVLQNQKCLRIANDQIKGFKERIHILEDEHRRLKEDYSKVCDEVVISREHPESKMPDDVFPPEAAGAKTDSSAHGHHKKHAPHKHTSSDADKEKLLQELAQYKLKSEELEYKVEELNEIWRSKSAASESERAKVEVTLKQRDTELAQLREQVTKLQGELDTAKTKVTSLQSALDAKARDLSAKKAEAAQQEELTSHRDVTLKELREAVRTRDERLREKDEIIGKLNTMAEKQRAQLSTLGDTMRDVSKRLEAKEAMVARLQEQVNAVTLTSTSSTGGQTDLEKDNLRLRHLLAATQGELERMRQDLVGLKADVSRSRQEGEAESLQWMQEKAEMQAELNSLEEKLRMYEIHATMQKGDVVATLRREAHEHFREKERLAGELGAVKRSAELAARRYREELASLQRDLADQAKRLGEEAEVRHRQQQDIERLRGQAEVATRAQKEEKLLRAEHVALQVQSEAAHERLSREVSRLTAINSRLQREHELDRDMIAGLQRSLLTAKAEHNHDRQLWQDERNKMEEDLKEIIQLRDEMGMIRHQALELQQRLVEAQRSRDDAAAQLVAQRSAWDLERTKLQSRINQLEERVALMERSQDGKQKRGELEAAWSRERAEQQRLLEEAHKLALDLQQQLRSREEAVARERLEMLRQHEMERTRWEREKREKDRKSSELEQQVRKQAGWQARCRELQEAMERDLQQALRERKLYLQRLTEARAQHQRDVTAVEDILHGLIRLRELGVLLSQDGSDAASEVTVYPPETEGDSGLRTQAVTQSQEAARDPDQTLVQHFKEALAQISQAAGEISKQIKYSDPKWQVRKSLSSSELDLLREELEADDAALESAGSSTLPRHHDVTTPAATTSLLTSPTSSKQFPSTYLSGTRSAHTSRAGSPAVLSPQASLPTPPPSFIIPQPLGGKRAGGDVRPSRPRTLVKSVSLDVPGSPPTYLETPSQSQQRSASASTTPTQPSAPSDHAHPRPSRSPAPGRLGPPTASSMENLSPRTARKKFFEGHARAQSVSSTEPFTMEAAGYMSWPERKSQSAAAQRRVPVDEEAVIRDAEQGAVTSQTSSRMVMSSSCDEKMLHGILVPPQGATPPYRSTTPTPAESQKEGAGSALSAKEKRKFFKKSSSLDSTVGSSIAKVGMQAMPVAALSGFHPSDLFAAVKGKFKGKKAKDGSSKGHGSSRPTSPIPATVEEEELSSTASAASASRSDPGAESPGDQTSPTDPRPGQTTTTTTSPQPAPQEAAESSRQGRSSRQEADTLSPPGDSSSKRWRSKSAERPQSRAKPILLHADVSKPVQVWQFSETAV